MWPRSIVRERERERDFVAPEAKAPLLIKHSWPRHSGKADVEKDLFLFVYVHLMQLHPGEEIAARWISESLPGENKTQLFNC